MRERVHVCVHRPVRGWEHRARVQAAGVLQL